MGIYHFFFLFAKNALQFVDAFINGLFKIGAVFFYKKVRSRNLQADLAIIIRRSPVGSLKQGYIGPDDPVGWGKFFQLLVNVLLQIVTVLKS